MNPVKFSLRYPLVTLVLACMVVAIGLYAFFTMPRTEDPTITIRAGLVLAQYPGATSGQVENQVTKVLEKHIFRFPEVRREKTFSTSRPGFVVVQVELEDYVRDVDLFWTRLRNELNEARATELPPGVRGPIVNSDFGDTVALLLAVHGERYGYRELSDMVDRIEDRLRTLRDVGKMARYGDQGEQVWITGSLARLSRYALDPRQIVQALHQRNVITGAGKADIGSSEVPLRTTGTFTGEDEIGSVMVGLSRMGRPVYIRDVADIERRYQDPLFLVRYDGKPSLLLSVEMQKGRNIVELGDHIRESLDELRSLLPPDVRIDFIADQPKVVKERISRLTHEFMLALGSVILVTILLLPLRVATIAALAIPITLCITLGVMNTVGVSLHQVSIAALIVVLGIVVDDAIVIADNYVDLLDRGKTRAEAAWLSVREVIVPVFTATVTIICSFLPLLIMTGSVGEFISALPLTVTIALSVSFVVAVMLTPILCRFFIKKGLHANGGEERKGRKGLAVLDGLQTLYRGAITYFMGRKTMALGLGVAAILLGTALFVFVPSQFFPSAERDQFVIDVWMRQGTRIEATDGAMKRIENYLSTVSGVVHYASLVGQSAPRFYYNVSPQQPDGAYGQFIVTARSEKDTPGLVTSLRRQLSTLVPEALVVVQELQQGLPMEAPVEVRISGDDFDKLKGLGNQVEDIMRAVPYAEFVHPDFFNDVFLVDIDVNEEIANRAGLTDASVSHLLSGAFDGIPAGMFWEGDRPVTILLRLAPESRSSFEDVKNAYMISPLTQGSLPLGSIAGVEPEWQTGRIVRRNGVPTLTVRSFVTAGHYASALLNTIEPRVEALDLPPGYRVEYGGERLNQEETLPRMLVALAISLGAIFLVLLIQFRNISEPLMVMSSIPLALLGAAAGLIVTRNPFGFTAFVGLISLCGIVVRNAIILVDYMDARLAEGHSLERAATEAGQRRLRPIFLTTMAAAVGVTPMILSGSSLWSPLASVIAIGLIFSMFFTLLVVPVLFVVVRSRISKTPASALLLVFLLTLFCVPNQAFADVRSLTLDETVEQALARNPSLKIARARVRENREKKLSVTADYFPHLSNETTYAGVTNKEIVTIPRGSLGSVPILGPFPLEDVGVDQGSQRFFISNTSLAQPLTQLFKIRQAERIAEADGQIAEADLKKAEADVVFAAHRLFYGLLLAHKQKEAARAAIAAGEEGLREARNGVESGALLEVTATGSRVLLLQSRQALLAAENRMADLNGEMCDLLDMPLDTVVEPVPSPRTGVPDPIKGPRLPDALDGNPEVRAAREAVRKAEGGVDAACYDYMPDLGLFGLYTHQDGVPFVDRNIGTYGIRMSWNIFDWGKRRAVLGQRKEQLVQARQNLYRIGKRVQVEMDKAYRRLEEAAMAIDVARESLLLQRENLRLAGDGIKAGTITAAKYAAADAAVKKAEGEELQALLGYDLALAEIQRIRGSRQALPDRP